MKKNTFILTLLIAILPFFSYSQCKEFTEADIIPMLGDYILSGRYNSVRLAEGEEILIFKTLSKGMNYRFVVAGDSELAKNVEFEIYDWNDKEIYKNKSNSYSKVWDYKSASSQRVKILIKVPKATDPANAKIGCVALVTGIKSE